MNTPAFPTHSTAFPTANQEGMTLRDYFAAKALTFIGRVPREHSTILEDVELAFQYADAMMKAREQ